MKTEIGRFRENACRCIPSKNTGSKPTKEKCIDCGGIVHKG